MGLLADTEIASLATVYDMINPFTPYQVREVNSSRVISYGLSSYGFDIRCADEFKVFGSQTSHSIIDPKNFNSAVLSTVKGEGSVVIPPNGFALTFSIEKVSMPRDITAIALGKSTYARCGIVVNITPIEAGWRGHITIEISNTTPAPVKVYANEGIAQLLFFRGNVPPAIDYAQRAGKYQDQQPEIVLPRL